MVALAACSLSFGSTIGQAGQTTVNGSTTSVKVHILRGADGSTLVEAPISINNHGPYNFIIDTGASVSVVDTVVANRLNLPVVGASQPVSGVGGSTIATPVKVAAWRLGQLTLPSATITKGNLPDAQHGQGLQGLLGSDVLSRFGQVTIDYANSNFIVYRTAASTSLQQRRYVALPADVRHPAL
jgi:predicted aspartyl protease